jgi:hypothetical protein
VKDDYTLFSGNYAYIVHVLGLPEAFSEETCASGEADLTGATVSETFTDEDSLESGVIVNLSDCSSETPSSDVFGETSPEAHKEKNKISETINRDLTRTPYLSSKFTVKQMQERWLSFFNEDQNRSYTQGDADAGVIPLSLLAILWGSHPLLIDNPQGLTVKNIRLSYIDDHDVNCGFTIASLKIEGDPNPHYMFSIIKDNFATIENRDVTFICYNDFLAEGILKKGHNITPKEIITTIKEKLASDDLFSLVTPLLIDTDRVINESAFNKLSERIIPNLNIDNRDRKAELFTKLDEIVKNDKLSDRFNELRESDVNFYQGDTDKGAFIKHCEDLIKQAKKNNPERVYGYKLDLSLAIIKLELLGDLAGRDQNTIDTGQEDGLRKVAALLREESAGKELIIKQLNVPQLEEYARGGFAFNYVLYKIKEALLKIEWVDTFH